MCVRIAERHERELWLLAKQNASKTLNQDSKCTPHFKKLVKRLTTKSTGLRVEVSHVTPNQAHVLGA